MAASALAAHGIPAFALAYFHAPGLPANLERIPLEYFASAVKLLGQQAGVDTTRIDLWGNSRGSEAALLTAADFPALVNGVIATVPGAEAFGGLGDGNLTVPAWAFRGHPVATAAVGDFSAQRADSPATIPVERIRGPLLFTCGTNDGVWNSCANSHLIATRLAGKGARAPAILQYTGAGHAIGNATPYIPNTTSTGSTGSTASGQALELGGTYPADQAARADEWPKINSIPPKRHNLTQPWRPSRQQVLDPSPYRDRLRPRGKSFPRLDEGSRYGTRHTKRYARRVLLTCRRHTQSSSCGYPQEGIDRSVGGRVVV